MPKLRCPNASANEMEMERQTNGPATPPRPLEVGYTDLRHPGSWSGSELLARILDGVADGIAAHDASGHLIFINDAGARMCGYDSATAALTAPSADFFERVRVYDPEGTPLAESELPGPLAARGRAVPERILCIQLRGCGTERWVSVKATPILDRRGAVRMSISIFRDVTRERRAEAERDRVLRELESERRRLTSLVEQLRAAATSPGLADR